MSSPFNLWFKSKDLSFVNFYNEKTKEIEKHLQRNDFADIKEKIKKQESKNNSYSTLKGFLTFLLVVSIIVVVILSIITIVHIDEIMDISQLPRLIALSILIISIVLLIYGIVSNKKKREKGIQLLQKLEKELKDKTIEENKRIQEMESDPINNFPSEFINTFKNEYLEFEKQGRDLYSEYCETHSTDVLKQAANYGNPLAIMESILIMMKSELLNTKQYGLEYFCSSTYYDLDTDKYSRDKKIADDYNYEIRDLLRLCKPDTFLFFSSNTIKPCRMYLSEAKQTEKAASYISNLLRYSKSDMRQKDFDDTLTYGKWVEVAAFSPILEKSIKGYNALFGLTYEDYERIGKKVRAQQENDKEKDEYFLAILPDVSEM